MQKIFTTGYTGKDINDLKPMSQALDAILVDVRICTVQSGFALAANVSQNPFGQKISPHSKSWQSHLQRRKNHYSKLKTGRGNRSEFRSQCGADVRL